MIRETNRLGRESRSFVLIISVLALSAVAAAQIRVDVRLVNVIPTVPDDHGRYVTNLNASDFLVEEDGKPQKIAHFTQDRDIPVNVGIVLDTSSSMERKLRTAVDAVNRFAGRIHQDDEIFVMTFSSKPFPRRDFTGDRKKVYQSMRGLLATGGTALYDALSDALDKIHFGSHKKDVILAITDGQDTSSFVKLDQVLRTIRESEVLVYGLGISPAPDSRRPSSKRDDVDMDVLRSLAETSGGAAFLITEGLPGGPNARMDEVLDRVADELRSQYTLGYYPELPDDGQYHTIRVRVRNGNSARARKGYVAAENRDQTATFRGPYR